MEYALIGVLIAAVIAGSVSTIGGPLSGMFSSAANGINNHPAAASGSSAGTGSSIGGN